MARDLSESTKYLYDVRSVGPDNRRHSGVSEPKTAWGYGRSSLAKLAYNPVLGERKSGIPAAVLIPAPILINGNSISILPFLLVILSPQLTITTTLCARPSLM